MLAASTLAVSCTTGRTLLTELKSFFTTTVEHLIGLSDCAQIQTGPQNIGTTAVTAMAVQIIIQGWCGTASFRIILLQGELLQYKVLWQIPNWLHAGAALTAHLHQLQGEAVWVATHLLSARCFSAAWHIEDGDHAIAGNTQSYVGCLRNTGKWTMNSARGTQLPVSPKCSSATPATTRVHWQ